MPLTTKDISVVFFGSGPVAAESLKLLAQNFTIEAVITKPRPAHFKGSFPVIDWCEQPDAPVGRVLTVTNKRELSQLFAEQQFSSRLGIVIDFGIIIAQDVIDAFELGIVNSHFSLLPQWRGADPITFSILSGQAQTGVSLMLITAGLDEGPLLAFGIYDLQGTETTPYLTDRLIALSDSLLVGTLPRYIEGVNRPYPQQEAAVALGRSPEPTYSRKLTKDDGVLDFTKPAAQLEREIRAFTGWPSSRTRIGERDVIITAAHVEGVPPDADNVQPGSIWHPPKRLGFYTSDGILAIDRLKPAGKADMAVQSFLAGYKV
ncbi:MAG TPA: methionyl-tRNA formyltransferase [Candidatus Saccharimonadales bacterium]|jgi:methionyl-tRNA formyltransferase